MNKDMEYIMKQHINLLGIEMEEYQEFIDKIVEETYSKMLEDKILEAYAVEAAKKIFEERLIKTSIPKIEIEENGKRL